MKTLSRVKSYTKEGYKDAIIEALDDLKSRVDDILCDHDKGIRDIEITIHISPGEISLINVNKNLYVGVEENE